MITRKDLNEDAFDAMVRQELIDQFHDLKLTMSQDSIEDKKLLKALKRVIKYNSIPGEKKPWNL